MDNLGEVFSQGNTPEACTETPKSLLFLYKQVSRRNGDHEWFRMTNAFILCDLVWKVQKGYAANREGNFMGAGQGLSTLKGMGVRLFHKTTFNFC